MSYIRYLQKDKKSLEQRITCCGRQFLINVGLQLLIPILFLHDNSFVRRNINRRTAKAAKPKRHRTSLHRRSAVVVMYYRSVLPVPNKVRRVAGQDRREITRVYTIYECRMQITVNPIGHFLRVRLCAREPSDSSRLRSPALCVSRLVWIGFTSSITNCTIASSVFRILPRRRSILVAETCRRRGRVPFSESCLL